VAGGAGPIHAGPIARELEIPLILIPRESSVFCAAGMLISDLQHDYVRTYARDLDKVDLAEVAGLFREMTDAACGTLAQEGIEAKKVQIGHAVDLRYVGQFNEVEVPFEFGGKVGARSLEETVRRFHERHDSLYGYSMAGAPVELINLRVTARGLTPKPKFARSPKAKAPASRALLGTRPAWFDGKWVRTPVFDGLSLHNGHHVKGPAIVQQPTTTIIVPTDFDLKVDEFNNYLMYRKGERPAALIRRLGRRN
jgi:N-methylhydantoinase A